MLHSLASSFFLKVRSPLTIHGNGHARRKNRRKFEVIELEWTSE
jgi:hypothetical protein